MNLCEFAKRIWKLYLLGESTEDMQELFAALDGNISIIGTGKHEFYEELSVFAEALGMEKPEREAIEFKIQSISAKEQPVSSGVRLVFGEFHVVGTGKYTEAKVNMDTRYTMVFKRTEEKQERGEEWKLVHVHQSIPYIDQKEGEYYPKTLMDQVDEANHRAEYLEHLASTDQLTGLLNHSSFYEKSERLLAERGSGFCITIDLDDFKRINDSYGHQEGDRVLQKMGEILRCLSGASGFSTVGRIGGDEFAVFSAEPASGEEACAVAEEILRQAEEYAGSGRVFPGISIGISKVEDGERLKEAFRRADDMLYKVKRSGKHGYRFYG